MKRFAWILLLLALICTGCQQEPTYTEPELPVVTQPAEKPEEAPIPEEEPQKTPTLPADALPAYLFEGASQNRLIAPDGTVLLSSPHELSLLQDPISGQYAGLLERCTEGIVYDEYGWASAEHTWCNLYDLTGQLLHTFPLNYISIIGNWVYGYHAETGTSSIYRLSDGSLFLDQLYSVQNLDDILVFRQDSWDAPGILLLPDETTIHLPAGMDPFGAIRNGDDVFLLVRDDQFRLGLASLDGQLLLEYRFQHHLGVRDNWLILRDETTTWQYHLQTGALELHGSGQLVSSVLSDCSIIQTGTDYPYTYALAAPDGRQLTHEPYPYINLIDDNEDGEPELFYGILETETEKRACFFRSDGVLVQSLLLGTSNLTPLLSKHVLLTDYQWDETAQVSTGSYTLVDLETGEPIRHWEGTNLHLAPLYYYTYSEMDSFSRGCFLLIYPNELGWTRYDLLDSQGNSLLKNCSSIFYRGNGVLQVEQGFTSGLMTLDGLWLYQESSFSALEDS